MAFLTSLLVVLHVIGLAVVFRLYVFPEDDYNILSQKPNTSYDYVIVGAGSAGSVLASRLSEDSHVTVLLIEAGGDDRNQPSMDIPLLAATNQGGEFDWAYKSEPQKYSSVGFTDKEKHIAIPALEWFFERLFFPEYPAGNIPELEWRCVSPKSPWPRGKVLGGSSQLNLMVYVRGHRHDYDSWAVNGCEGWSYKDVLPYFKKSEDIQIDSLKSSDYHGNGGPLKVTQPYLSPVTKFFIKAGRELGFQELDINGENQEGFSYHQTTIWNGERMSTSKAFIWSVINRSNLHVLPHSHVTKIIIKNKKAMGVEYIKDGRLFRVSSSREVILSAGVIGSPQLLMLSGIGPKKHLENVKIPVEADLPVGDNLQDHFILPIASSTKQFLSLPLQDIFSVWTKLQYMALKTGLLTSCAGAEASAFIKTTPQEKSPDLQFIFLSTIFNDALMEMANVDQDLRRHINWSQHDGFTTVPIILRPKSRGTVRLRSSNPFEDPVIDPNYLSHPDDVKTLIRGVRFVQKMHNTTTYKEIGADMLETIIPGCRNLKYDTDAFWECHIRALGMTIYHGSGTCKMGKLKEKDTVVDSKLRVKGISGLRVVDASIMPNIASGNTNAPAIMIGEKGADLIRQDNKV